MKTVDDIFSLPSGPGVAYNYWITQAKAALYAATLEIIGEDYEYGSTKDYRLARNEEKAELRTAARKFYGVDDVS